MVILSVFFYVKISISLIVYWVWHNLSALDSGRMLEQLTWYYSQTLLFSHPGSGPSYFHSMQYRIFSNTNTATSLFRSLLPTPKGDLNSDVPLNLLTSQLVDYCSCTVLMVIVLKHDCWLFKLPRPGRAAGLVHCLFIQPWWANWWGWCDFIIIYTYVMHHVSGLKS